MKYSFFVLCCTMVLGGCSGSSEWLLGDRDCGYIGCETGNLEFYPNEPFGAQTQPRRICGFEWGESSSAYHPSSKKYKELRQAELDKWHGEGTAELCIK